MELENCPNCNSLAERRFGSGVFIACSDRGHCWLSGPRDDPDGANVLRELFPDMSVVHTVNNLGLVVWALTRYPDDFDAAIGDVVAAGLDTDCNGATVGALWALQGKPIPTHWTAPWQNKVGVSLAGMALLDLDSLVDRTVKVAQSLSP